MRRRVRVGSGVRIGRCGPRCARLGGLADAGSSDAADVLVDLASEREDFAELRRLADLGNTDAADVLTELES